MSELPPQEEQVAPGDLPVEPGHDTRRAEQTRLVPAENPAENVPPEWQVRPRARPASAGARDPRRAAAGPPPPYPVPAQTAPPRPLRSATPHGSTRASDSGLYLPWWSLVVMVGAVGFMAFGLLWVVSAFSDPQTPGDQVPRVQLVTSQPTLSQAFAPAGGVGFPTAIPQVFPTATLPLPTPIPSPSMPPGEFVIGASVHVVGVESAGLNVRADPGYGGTLRFLAYDGDIFVLVEGPREVDDLEWWQIEDPDDPDRTGWAVRNYLMIEP